MYRTIQIGSVSMNGHIMVSGAYKVARISVFDTHDKKLAERDAVNRNP